MVKTIDAATRGEHMKQSTPLQFFFYRWHFTVFFVISAVIHLSLFLPFSPAATKHKPVRRDLFDVDLIPRQKVPRREAPSGLRPPSAEPLSASPQQQAQQEDPHVAQEKEDTICLASPDKTDQKYPAYQQHLWYKINAVWQYLPAGQDRNSEGELTLRFTIAKDGKLLDVTILQQSGLPGLDRAGLRAIRDAAPFDHLPPGSNLVRLHVLASFIYRVAPQ